MSNRLAYAVNATAHNLQAVFKTRAEFEITLAFLLTMVGFGAMQFALNHDVYNVFSAVVVGFAMGAIFFLSAIGFITVITVVFVFAYAFTVDRNDGVSSKLTGWGQGLRVVLSFTVGGAITAAVFNLFYEGLKEIPIDRLL